MSKPFLKLVILDVHQKAEMLHEVNAKDGLLDISYDEYSMQSTLETEVGM